MLHRYPTILGLAALLSTTACSGGTVIGDWQSEELIGTERNTLTLDEAGTGTATIFIMQVVNGQSTVSAFSFTAEYQEDPDYADRYEVEMDCEESPWGECDDGDDFDMECRFNGDLLELRCSGDNNFRDYEALDFLKPTH